MPYSAIIRTKNSESSIEECLRKLMLQSILPTKVIIVDNYSTDSTIEICQKYNCLVLHYPDIPFNYSKALNIGISESNEDFVLIMSSHIYLNDIDLVKICLHDFLNARVCAVSAMPRSKDYKWNEIKNYYEKQIIDKSNFRGFAMNNSLALIKKSDWEKLKFDEEIPRCEDQIWAFNKLINDAKTTIIYKQLRCVYNNPYFTNRKWYLDNIFIFRKFSYLKIRGRFLSDIFISIIVQIFRGNIKYGLMHVILLMRIIRDRIYPYDIPSGHI